MASCVFAAAERQCTVSEWTGTPPQGHGWRANTSTRRETELAVGLLQEDSAVFGLGAHPPEEWFVGKGAVKPDQPIAADLRVDCFHGLTHLERANDRRRSLQALVHIAPINNSIHVFVARTSFLLGRLRLFRAVGRSTQGPPVQQVRDLLGTCSTQSQTSCRRQ